MYRFFQRSPREIQFEKKKEEDFLLFSTLQILNMSKSEQTEPKLDYTILNKRR